MPERPLNQLANLQRNAMVFTPRTKYMLDLYSTAVNYQEQRQRSHSKDHLASPRRQPTSTPENRRSFRLETVPVLPIIVTSSHANDNSASSSDREKHPASVSPTMDTNHTHSVESVLASNSSGRKLNPILIPSSSWGRKRNDLEWTH